MSDPQQIPTPDELTTPFIDALVSRLPTALPPINSDVSRWNDIIYGVKAETRLLRARLADEVVAARLPLATGRALLELARSEYWVEADVGPKTAVGGAILIRTLTNTSSASTGNFSRGIIPAGIRFRKVANTIASPPVAEAVYTVTNPMVVDDAETNAPVDNHDGTFTHTQQVLGVGLVCDRPGAHANTPIFLIGGLPLGLPTVQVTDTLFDRTFKVLLAGAATGSDGMSDPALRMLAQANYSGQFAPTDGALVAGLLASTGVEHLAVVEDTVNAITKLFIADVSWGTSGAAMQVVEQRLKDNWQGFGCQCKVFPVYNQRITVDATVSVTDPKFLSDSTDLADTLGKAVRAYFDDRPDWYTWRTRAIEAAIAGADRRVLTVQSVVVRNAETGVSIGQPDAKIAPTASFATHYFLTDNGVRLTLAGP